MHLMSDGNIVDMVYLDFAKAFDMVAHGVLLHKIKTLGITGKLGVVWLYHFLTHRTHFVRLQRGISHASPVLSGVPPGYCLGSTSFSYFNGDINSGISSSSIVSYADDTRLYHGISNVETSFLQHDLNSVYTWASCNNMSFNAQKLQCICSSPHSSSSSNVYTSSSFDIINYSKNILDLGINVSSDCSFDFHISNLVKRTKHLTCWILRTFSSRVNVDLV